MKQIQEVATLAGITIETLRHYDRIGLLAPRARSAAGYRLYGHEELLRLREIMIWRQLGFPLADIAALIDDPRHDRAEALRRQLDLVREQHSRFGAMLGGLEAAIAAEEGGRSMLDADVFDGFDLSLSTDDLERDSVTARLRLVDGPSRLRSAPDTEIPFRPRRIVATNPVRLGENLLALGILPAGVGSLLDHSTGVLFCAWPELVEAPIRDRVRSVGYFGSRKDLIAAAQPDLILDLHFLELGATGSEIHSDGRCSYDDLCEIAPTALFESPLGPPAFLSRIEQLGAALRVEERVEPLLASWSARVRALREHVAGQTVSALNTTASKISSSTGSEDLVGVAPTLSSEGQVFSELGLELACPPEEPARHGGRAVRVTTENLGELSAPTLFVTLDCQALPGPVHRLATQGPLASLPAVRTGRVFDLRWLRRGSGWFTAHWQLDVIARAFGVSCLRTAGSTAPVHLAIAPDGKATMVSSVECGTATLSGPGIPEVRLDLEPGAAACVDLGDVAGDVCACPEGYSLWTERSGPRPLVVDRESALGRLARQRSAA